MTAWFSGRKVSPPQQISLRGEHCECIVTEQWVSIDHDLNGMCGVEFSRSIEYQVEFNVTTSSTSETGFSFSFGKKDVFEIGQSIKNTFGIAIQFAKRQTDRLDVPVRPPKCGSIHIEILQLKREFCVKRKRLLGIFPRRDLHFEYLSAATTVSSNVVHNDPACRCGDHDGPRPAGLVDIILGKVQLILPSFVSSTGESLLSIFGNDVAFEFGDVTLPEEIMPAFVIKLAGMKQSKMVGVHITPHSHETFAEVEAEEVHEDAPREPTAA